MGLAIGDAISISRRARLIADLLRTAPTSWWNPPSLSPRRFTTAHLKPIPATESGRLGTTCHL